MGQSRSGKNTRFTATSVPLTSIQTKQVGDVHRDVTGRLPSFIVETGEIVSFEDEIGDNLEGFSDAGEILAAELNEFLEEVGDYTKFESDEITQWIKLTLSPVQLSAYMSNKFGHGLIMGRFLEFQNIITEIENDEEFEEDDESEEQD